MFDPSKLDISDELKSVIEELQPFEEKVCCVLNKADNLDIESLMRVSSVSPSQTAKNCVIGHVAGVRGAAVEYGQGVSRSRSDSSFRGQLSRSGTDA